MSNPTPSKPPVDPVVMMAARLVERINQGQVYSMAYQGSTDAEIAARFDVPEPDVARDWRRELQHARAMRALGIRQAQTRAAIDPKRPNATLAVWLGRNELGQTNDPYTVGEAEPVLEMQDTALAGMLPTSPVDDS
jgi:transposase-like protein